MGPHDDTGAGIPLGISSGLARTITTEVASIEVNQLEAETQIPAQIKNFFLNFNFLPELLLAIQLNLKPEQIPTNQEFRSLYDSTQDFKALEARSKKRIMTARHLHQILSFYFPSDHYTVIDPEFFLEHPLMTGDEKLTSESIQALAKLLLGFNPRRNNQQQEAFDRHPNNFQRNDSQPGLLNREQPKPIILPFASIHYVQLAKDYKEFYQPAAVEWILGIIFPPRNNTPDYTFYIFHNEASRDLFNEFSFIWQSGLINNQGDVPAATLRTPLILQNVDVTWQSTSADQNALWCVYNALQATKIWSNGGNLTTPYPLKALVTHFGKHQYIENIPFILKSMLIHVRDKLTHDRLKNALNGFPMSSWHGVGEFADNYHPINHTIQINTSKRQQALSWFRRHWLRFSLASPLLDKVLFYTLLLLQQSISELVEVFLPTHDPQDSLEEHFSERIVELSQKAWLPITFLVAQAVAQHNNKLAWWYVRSGFILSSISTLLSAYIALLHLPKICAGKDFHLDHIGWLYGEIITKNFFYCLINAYVVSEIKLNKIIVPALAGTLFQSAGKFFHLKFEAPLIEIIFNFLAIFSLLFPYVTDQNFGCFKRAEHHDVNNPNNATSEIKNKCIVFFKTLIYGCLAAFPVITQSFAKFKVESDICEYSTNPLPLLAERNEVDGLIELCKLFLLLEGLEVAFEIIISNSIEQANQLIRQSRFNSARHLINYYQSLSRKTIIALGLFIGGIAFAITAGETLRNSTPSHDSNTTNIHTGMNINLLADPYFDNCTLDLYYYWIINGIYYWTGMACTLLLVRIYTELNDSINFVIYPTNHNQKIVANNPSNSTRAITEENELTQRLLEDVENRPEHSITNQVRTNELINQLLLNKPPFSKIIYFGINIVLFSFALITYAIANNSEYCAAEKESYFNLAYGIISLFTLWCALLFIQARKLYAVKLIEDVCRDSHEKYWSKEVRYNNPVSLDPVFFYNQEMELYKQNKLFSSLRSSSLIIANENVSIDQAIKGVYIPYTIPNESNLSDVIFFAYVHHAIKYNNQQIWQYLEISDGNDKEFLERVINEYNGEFTKLLFNKRYQTLKNNFDVLRRRYSIHQGDTLDPRLSIYTPEHGNDHTVRVFEREGFPNIYLSLSQTNPERYYLLFSSGNELVEERHINNINRSHRNTHDSSIEVRHP